MCYFVSVCYPVYGLKTLYKDTLHHIHKSQPPLASHKWCQRVYSGLYKVQQHVVFMFPLTNPYDRYNPCFPVALCLIATNGGDKFYDESCIQSEGGGFTSFGFTFGLLRCHPSFILSSWVIGLQRLGLWTITDIILCSTTKLFSVIYLPSAKEQRE